ncbi:hypothetical protein LWI29_022333 [Acer saccharum]|uniref:Retrotransposon gag domain-containing protein n=1 Tax=Acer saccharum TaxID=4024 RepID=A0AA39RSN4_ACESA|nr:hypothetical protein LWI29_022333 [Acer saccharum]
MPSNELEDDTVLNTADATLTTVDQSAALAGLMSPHNLSAPNQQTARLRSAVVIPTPDAPPKARRDPAGRPEMLSERVARRSREHREGNDSDKGYDQDRIAGDRDHPRRRSHQRDRSSSSEEREPEGDRDILIQSLTREVQNNRRQMDALVRRYGRNELSDDESRSPFTNGVLRMPFPERYRMPHIELFKKDTDPKEHVRRYRSAMAQYVHNDALLCLNFPQTLGDLGSRWFGRLPAASISSFGKLSKAFSMQFLGNVHRKKSVAHLSQLKQGKDESLKRYLGRFGQEVFEIGSANDEAIIASFINNL